MEQKMYICIDLKSYYASFECVERGLDPMKTNLVVADESRTQKTICLAASPALKQLGFSGRARLFEVVEKVRAINAKRLELADGHKFSGSSYNSDELKNNKNLEFSFIAAPPRMKKYMECSTKIYGIYLKYIAPEDIHIYSIDEVFIDATAYLKSYNLTPQRLASKMIYDVFSATGITATAGIGTNMYLAKVALDIMAKHAPADENGVRIAQLDEMSYRKRLWNHTPITDFWRVGRGYAEKLHANGIYTMGDIARCSEGQKGDFYNEDLLYRLFGINAELLIDHAWGYEPCTMSDIKAYKPSSNSIGTGQVLHFPHSFEKAKLIMLEMADALALDLVDKGLITDRIVINVGYDIENLKNPQIASQYKGEITKDFYGRKVPKHAHGTVNLGTQTASARKIINAVSELFTSIVNENLLIRRLNITAINVICEQDKKHIFEQLDLFSDYEQERKERIREQKEKDIQHTILDIKKKYGKNSVVKGMNLQDGATAIERNGQVGGHKE